MRKQSLLILSILFISSIMRFVGLGDIPAGISLQEAKFGLLLSGVFGTWFLNPLVVRLPFAVLGIVSIFIFFKLVQKISKSDSIALISSLLLAVVPWHIQESRIFSWGMVVFTLAISALYFFADKFLKRVEMFFKYSLTIAIFIFGISVLVILPGAVSKVNTDRQLVTGASPAILSKLFINKYVENYRQREKILFENLDFGNLFFNGHPRERWGIEDEQKLLAFLIPFIFIGLFVAERKVNKLLFSWTFLSLAFLTLFSLRTSETLILVLPLIILASYGIKKAWTKGKSIKVFSILLLMYGAYEFLVFGILYLSNNSESLFSPRRPVYSEVVSAIRATKKTEDEVVVSTKLIAPEPFFSFYLKKDTKNYEFREFVYWQETKDNKLFIDVRSDDPSPSEPLYKAGGGWPSTISVLGEFYDKGRRQTVVIYRII